MIQINDDTNDIFKGSPEEIIAQFHASANMIGRRSSDQEYMESVASRLSASTGCDIRTDSATNFLEDIAEAGMADILEA